MTDILFVIPPGLIDVVAHHEATTGMGALAPADLALGAAGFLYPPQTVAACVAATRAAGMRASVLDGTRAQSAGGVRPGGRARAVRPPGGAGKSGDGLRRCQLPAAAPAGGPRRGSSPRLLLFGPSAHLVAGALLAEGLADAALLGEPEGALAEAAGRLAAGGGAGVVAAGELRPELYDGSGLLSDLNALPFPAWDIVPWQPYEMVSLLSSRGCPDGCLYCAYIVAQGHRTRMQRVERTLAEWDWLAREVRPPYLLVRDPVFAADPARVRSLCEGLTGRGIQIPWACESRPEHFNLGLLQTMKAAGCVTVKIGMESGDPDLLAAVGRLGEGQRAGDFLDQVRRVAADCRQVGMRCRVFVIAGLPGQGPDSLAHTEAALRRLAPEAIIHAAPYQGHPGAGLTAPSASVSPDVLERLRYANAPASPLWRRVARRVLSSGGAEGRRSRGAEGQAVAPSPSHPHPHTSPPSAPEFDWSRSRVFLDRRQRLPGRARGAGAGRGWRTGPGVGSARQRSRRVGRAAGQDRAWGPDAAVGLARSFAGMPVMFPRGRALRRRGRGRSDVRR